MKTEEQLIKEIEDFDMEGIVKLWAELRYSDSSLNKCKTQELISFVKKACKVERELEALRVELTCVQEIKSLISVPCCHVTGMHNPEHFDDKKYVCDMQMSKAFIDLLKKLGIEKIKVESKEGCYWCNYSKEHPGEKTNNSYKSYMYNINTEKIE